ncbi:MAG TPA: hypothetical protein VLG27_03980 [Candidatus Saccharimonadia bacterium]|nr:hypothetical protein [Candidatus Saccharimonadia bacterium]
MAPELNTTTNSGGQNTSTAPLQSSQQSLGGGTPAGSVQPGTGSSLQGTSGSALSGTGIPLSVLTSGTTTSQTHAQTAVAATPEHHANGVLLGFAGLLIIVALVLFFVAGRPVKSTT